jgi:hypothetical protein
MALSEGSLKAQLTNGSVLYQLNPESSFQQGCFPPCLCPVMIAVPVKGTFVLTPTGVDPLFSHYAVTDVNWSVPISGSNMVVTGSGTYKIGGEFALQQQLSLDLQLGGAKVEHFDSGLVAGPAPFPKIQATISMNGLVCFDTVFYVSAAPGPEPLVRVALTSTNMIALSWPVSASPCVLQESSDLTTWTIVTNKPNAVGQQNQVVLPRSSANKFYLLQTGGN